MPNYWRPQVKRTDSEHTTRTPRAAYNKNKRPSYGKNTSKERDSEQKKEFRAKMNKREEEGRAAYTFSNAIMLAALNAGVQEQVEEADSHCPLACLSYEEELALKTDAVKAFWKVNNLPYELIDSVIPSPAGRACRTTSKRRIYIDRKRKVRFTMGYSGTQREETIKSPLEPENHGEIYEYLHKLFTTPAYLPIVRYLNFIVIRGNYENLALILNMFRLDAAAVRKIRVLADKIQSDFPCVRSMFTFMDETRSEFYLESKATSHPFRKIFGPEVLDVTVNDMKFLFPPGAFSQVNESILPAFTAEAAKMADLNDAITFYDLYCGYGLFGITAGAKAGRVIGVDFNGPAIQAASGNASHIAPRHNIRFIPSAVTSKTITDDLPPEADDEVFLLDPPRNGVAANVISAIAERKPLRAVHVFCSADEVAKSLRAWKSAGYVPANVSVFDMFPGTPNVETMVLLTKRQPKKRIVEKKTSARRQTNGKTGEKRTPKKDFGKRNSGTPRRTSSRRG